MNKRHLYPRLLSLLLLLLYVAAARGQTYSLEYWFDKYSSSGAKSVSMSGTSFNKKISVTSLKAGFHTIYMRVKASDGTYSPVTSSSFLKFNGSGSSKLEYWFDNDVSKRATTDVDIASEVVQILDLDLSDVEKFPLGVHQLNMRVAAYGGHYSPVYSAMVLRLPSGTGDSVLEYWFDDDITKMGTIPVNIESGLIQQLNLDMTNMVNFPLGFHRLNMRVAAYGCQYSPVYSAYVMRLPQGRATEIIYWLDDDYKNGRHVLTGNSLTATTTIFNTQLNLSTAPIGMHRFKYRVAYNGFDDGVVYEVPVLITKKYNSMGEVTVVAESRWLDEASPAEFAVSNPNSIVTRSYTLDPASYTVGQHAFHVQYKNSADVWGEQNVTYFYKDESGKLRAGLIPDDSDGTDGIGEADVDEFFICTSERGSIFIDCQSPRLAPTGIVQVYDMTGKMVARQSVNNSDGIHAEISVEGYTKQILIVRLICGEVVFNKKLVIH
ncbi:MAG: hypothetical protein IKX36_07120 [Prevotella sp.]|nr:hypothetical protein [Prevotella sp.]